MLLIDPYTGYICNSDTKVDQTHKEKKEWRYFELRRNLKGQRDLKKVAPKRSYSKKTKQKIGIQGQI